MGIAKRYGPYAWHHQRIENLHDAFIPDDGRGEDVRRLRDYSCISSCGSIEIHLRDLERRLIEKIEAADYVLGCVAWLTSEPILDALARKHGVQIVVQKEDFLRPDLAPKDRWRQRLREAYERLRMPIERHFWPDPVGSLSVCSDPTIDPVRCVGNHNREKAPAFPRAHHKFVLFCRAVPGDEYTGPWFEPYGVWTGSFNFTKNAGRSLENAVYMTDPFVVAAYEQEYLQIVGISEPLDWNTAWVAPEWRIGT